MKSERARRKDEKLRLFSKPTALKSSELLAFFINIAKNLLGRRISTESVRSRSEVERARHKVKKLRLFSKPTALKSSKLLAFS